ncbi:GCS-domain-containing protein [Piedraia hortae CBS 480.64]|uniref:Glutamate--cysteine ligase n=1 Tax=Piedraia hortae CBS 480.64 TaxID=1314780 RepID=A0A6A7BT30_9PEZI|nr:GCS-domain-containing protein [Piedraia hortae CBS 480.64]
MGLLAIGTPLNWEETKQAADKVREWGIEQLLAIWRRAKDKEGDALRWGDEIEYLVVSFADQDRRVLLSLRQAEILQALAKDRSSDEKGKTAPIFHPEFGRFMLEATPGAPWGIGCKELLDVEPDMRWRRELAKKHLKSTECPVTLTTFPLLGDRVSITPYYPPSGPKLRSQFVPDEIANPHIRFPTLAAHIRERRGRKVQLNVPVFHDEKTVRPWWDPTVDYDLHKWPEDSDVRNGAVLQDCVYMDAMAFGMGSCCLQITLQAKNIAEGRTMYDQLSPLGPILLALTAATPIYKGFLVNTDVRWNQVSGSVDDRTPGELGEKPLGSNDRWRIPKSRYASNSTYISQDSRLRPEYLDPDLVVDEHLKSMLMEGGMDELLATHFAHLFIRDPLVVFGEDLLELDLLNADHFENLQSTNWQHMRFKPPPAGTDTGWRVEVRPMEIQISDFDNAAFSVFVVLITRAILSFDLNFYVPIARTTENMSRAHARDAVLQERFFFRKTPFASGPFELAVEDEYEAMTVDEIINGMPGGFPGLVPLVESYLDSINVDVETRCSLTKYLVLIRGRASGAIPTPARIIRQFVRQHPEYKYDSIVTPGITYDLIKSIEQMQ